MKTIINRYIALTIVPLLLLNLLAVAQEVENPHVLKQYDFIYYENNTLNFYNDSSNFETLFGRLDDLIFEGKGKISVLQVGGSHIQADIWSDRIRQNFFKFSPGLNGGRGFLFPFTMAHTNNPYYYKVTYTGSWEGFRSSVKEHESEYGVSGITATTHDSLTSFQIAFRNKHCPKYDFNRVKVFHDLDSTGYKLAFVADSNHTVVVNEEIGYTEFLFDHYIDSVAFTITKTDTLQDHFNLYGLTLETDDPGIVYHAIGVNGASTESYLRCNKFTQHLSALKPDLVIFCMGINDAYHPDFSAKDYEHNYDTLVQWIRAVSPDAAIIFTTNNDSYYKRRYPNRRAEQIRTVMISLAKRHGAAVWDLYGVMGGLGSSRTWERNKLVKRDKIHFTRTGYRLVGDLMFSALVGAYDNHLKLAFE
ncbi:MAG TPA: hypothetical protein EYN71_10435 [Flavobacteriales bacterium]|nr:hypothetical protein [Flavobacteriales bacterium]HIO67371.1 hypothetical protein [Flavobacteriales bacterium]